ncbi:conserved hypothetical protein [Ricinus communis]|uniref:Uncharacterized protein n=1 Tax=Ricinus communis TaxID=3988 RepID=B9RV75_RICCO|nr:conserved hypothetical protein [Ricinus communis]
MEQEREKKGPHDPVEYRERERERGWIWESQSFFINLKKNSDIGYNPYNRMLD